VSLADRAKVGAPPSRQGPGCQTGALLASLPEGERDALLSMLAEGSGWSAKQIHEALVDEGLRTPGFKSVERHRRGDCACA